MPARYLLPRLVLTIAALSALATRTSASPQQTQDRIAQNATELLATKCLPCHNTKTKSGGFDFERRDHALTYLSPDKPEESRVARVVQEGKMPPNAKLPGSEVALLKRWITAGAKYPKEPLSPVVHTIAPLWSFQPVRKPSVPTTPFDRLSKNPVDRFVFAKLAQKGLKPSLPAARLPLLRRVTLDLTGLPPTPQEISAFLSDKSPSAYEKVVDRLLASPAYGERWGRHWLDIVRFGESHGYEQNHLRPNAWPYRDYVIRAFNEDKPYNQFITEQLAGDVVGKGAPNIETATGFLVAGIHDTVGIQTDEGTRQQRSNDLDDMVATTGAAFLGLTIGCAKCHDHKFDPIPQRDYYRMTAVFAGVRHGERPLTVRQLTEKEQREAQSVRTRLQQIANEKGDIETTARALVLKQRGKTPATRPAVNARRNVDDFAPVNAKFVRFTVLATVDGAEPGLDELQVYGEAGDKNLALAATGAKATASSLLPNFPIHQIAHLNDGILGNEHSWISNEAGKGWAQIELPAPASVRRVVWSRDGGDNPRFDDRLATSYRIEVSRDGKSWQTVSTEAGRTAANVIVAYTDILAAMTPDQQAQIKHLNAERETLTKRSEELSPTRNAYIGQFSAPEPVYLLRRGDVMQRGDLVTPGALSQIKTLASDLLPNESTPEPERRLALARWIASPQNPLTARVLVNRLWQYHFGRGLVSTPSDFGHNGEKPSHPELLDWLTARFTGEGKPPATIKTQRHEEEEESHAKAQRRKEGKTNSVKEASASRPTGRLAGGHTDGYFSARLTGTRSRDAAWSLKAMHRLMVTSYAYRQASEANAKGMAADAGNTLLWRMPLQRVDGETLRDAILATSGKLNRTMGGPGYPLFQYRVVNVAIYDTLEDYGPQTWRRGVYQQAARAIRDPLLGAFDCPESSVRAPRRESTTTALQSLALLNGPFITQQAGFFAERVRRQAGQNAAKQVQSAFQLAFGRPPTPTEQADAVALVKAVGLPDLCRALLNANEFLYY